MKNELKEIIDLIEHLNYNLKKKIIKNTELSEEKENIVEYIELINEIKQLIENSKTLDVNNSTEVTELLANLYYRLANVEWHVNQVYELVGRLMGYYEECK